MLKTFIASANLRNFLAGSRCPPCLQSFQPSLHKLLHLDTHNTLFTDIRSLQTEHSVFDNRHLYYRHLDQQTWIALQSILRRRPDYTVKSLSYVTHSSVKYAPQSISVGNSLVLFRPDTSSREVVPGCVQKIFLHDVDEREVVFLAIKRQKSIELAKLPRKMDPYERYPIYGAKIWHRDLASEVEVIRLDQVLSHFARCPFNPGDGTSKDRWQGVVVLPLYRVRIYVFISVHFLMTNRVKIID